MKPHCTGLQFEAVIAWSNAEKIRLRAIGAKQSKCSSTGLGIPRHASGGSHDTTDGGREASKSRCESVTSFLPGSNTLRHACEWQMPHRGGPCLVRLAHHEAGHVAVMEWLGLTEIKAEATPVSGLTHWPLGVFESLPQPAPDPSGIYAATAAAVYHAGVIAELLQMGTTWRGPIFYPEQSDYAKADDMLRETFGRHASGAHAFAQKVALNVLIDRWERVLEVAAHLIEHGVWRSETATTPAKFGTQHGAKTW